MKTDTICEAMPFEEAVKTYADLVMQLCVLHLRNPSDTEDCWQDVFITLYQHPEVLARPPEQVRFWLVRVTLNRCYDINRHAAHRLHLSLDDSDRLGISHTDSYTVEVIDCLRSLPEKYRAPMLLHYCRGYSVRETAAILRRREGTVKSQLQRGRELLKGALNFE